MVIASAFRLLFGFTQPVDRRTYVVTGVTLMAVKPTRLAFDVAAQPEPLRELSPYPFVYSGHLEGTFTSERGEFVLVPDDQGGTTLEGSTWYRMSLFPEPYWTLWTDVLIQAIHLRVLRHLKVAVESDVARSATATPAARPVSPHAPLELLPNVGYDDVVEPLRPHGVYP